MHFQDHLMQNQWSYSGYGKGELRVEFKSGIYIYNLFILQHMFENMLRELE